MRLRPFLVVSLFTASFAVLSACDSDPGTPELRLEILETNLGDDGAIQRGGGLVVRLSAPLDTASLGHRRLIDTGSLGFMGEDGEFHEQTWPYDLWGVRDAEHVTFDGAPATFWYDPATATLVFFEETTEPDPEGRPGTGWRAGALRFSPEVRSVDGAAFSADASLSVAVRPAENFLDLVSAVPNPALFTTHYARGPDERRIRFVNLPPEALITVFDPAGAPVATVENDEGRTIADWLAPQDQSGVFTYRVESSAGVAEDRVVILADTKPDFAE